MNLTDANARRSANASRAQRVAVIGAGVAGAACAAGLRQAGMDVTVFEKARGPGGRMATRRAVWTDAAGATQVAHFDHGCPQFTVTRPRFRRVVHRAELLGHVQRWRQHVYAPFPAPQMRDVVVPTPTMPSLCRHLLDGTDVQLGQPVTRLQRSADGWYLQRSDGAGESGGWEGPFQKVMLAIPPAQAATLLAGHRDDWTGALNALPHAPCWTLMAVTDRADTTDWPWDAAELEAGVLARIDRNDRKPGRGDLNAPGAPAFAQWVAHATPAWSLAHLEDSPAEVEAALRAALGQLLMGGATPRWHYTTVHRWRYARRTEAAALDVDCWWDPASGLGVCGDLFGDGSVESAWCSGDELADTVAGSTAPVTSPVRMSTARGRGSMPPVPARRRERSTFPFTQAT